MIKKIGLNESVQTHSKNIGVQGKTTFQTPYVIESSYNSLLLEYNAFKHTGSFTPLNETYFTTDYGQVCYKANAALNKTVDGVVYKAYLPYRRVITSETYPYLYLKTGDTFAIGAELYEWDSENEDMFVSDFDIYAVLHPTGTYPLYVEEELAASTSYKGVTSIDLEGFKQAYTLNDAGIRAGFVQGGTMYRDLIFGLMINTTPSAYTDTCSGEESDNQDWEGYRKFWVDLEDGNRTTAIYIPIDTIPESGVTAYTVKGTTTYTGTLTDVEGGPGIEYACMIQSSLDGSNYIDFYDFTANGNGSYKEINGVPFGMYLKVVSDELSTGELDIWICE